MGKALAAELRLARGQLLELAASGARCAAAPRLLGWRAALVIVWLLGITVDATSTLLMMATGEFEEANGVANRGMEIVGPVGYTALASALCVALTMVGAGRPRGRYAGVAFATLAVLGALKLYVALHNVLLWMAA